MLPTELSLSEDFAPVSYEAWRAAVEAALNGVPFEKKLVSHTYEGIDIQPLYTRQDWPAEGDPSGFPGLAPFTRGSTPLDHLRDGWDIRQEHALPDPAEANRAILTDLERGVTSILLRLDAAARNGLDPDDEEAAALAGRDGVMLYGLDDAATALSGVHLQMAGLALEAGAAAAPAAALLAAYADRQGVARADLRLAFNADPLAVLARDGQLPVPLGGALRDLADLARWTSRHLPASTSVRVGTAPYHHAGATAAQDLGFSMATGILYLRTLTDAGLSLQAATRQIVFSYSVGTNFFLAIAKLRAARKLWARVVEASGGDRDAQRMRLHVRTSKRVITTRDPWVNLLRNTVGTFAGAVAGADAITSEPFDKALGLSNDFSRRIARNTQLILQEESHLGRVLDPAGGSWMIESITDELAEKAWQTMQAVEAQGGMAEALTSGWVADQIESAFKPRLYNLAHRKDPITGVSEFPNLAEPPLQREMPDVDALRADACARRTRADEAGRAALARLAGAADGEQRIDALIEAAAHGASIGELAGALWPDAGEALSIAPLAPHPYAEPFEALRDASDAYLARTGRRPAVFLANLGPVAHYTARATYAKNFFEAGGFAVIGDRGFASPDAAAEAFAQSDAAIAVICSSDKLYESLVTEAAPKLKAAGARTVLLAGFPGDREDAYREAGVDRFIFIKCNVLHTLRDLLLEEGVFEA